jgi:GNAT superfamily N-acetyltransferase
MSVKFQHFHDMMSCEQSRNQTSELEVSDFVAQPDIIIVDDKLLPQAVDLYNGIFRPRHEVDYFKRRFTGRYNVLTLLARLDDRPVGFWIGYELKPGLFYLWLGAVTTDLRRHGIARQLQEAQQSWAKDHGYEYIRCECMNHQREFIHFAIALGYDIVGIRWDSLHADNLIVFEKNLVE